MHRTNLLSLENSFVDRKPSEVLTSDQFVKREDECEIPKQTQPITRISDKVEWHLGVLGDGGGGLTLPSKTLYSSCI